MSWPRGSRRGPIRVQSRFAHERFGIARPRLAVAGLNPHAGEDGALGDEDLTLVRPAVERLRAEGIDARGPLPADSLFHEAARASYDVALAMYHDQALIPRLAIRAHIARSRYRLRHRRHRPRRSHEPDRRP